MRAMGPLTSVFAAVMALQGELLQQMAINRARLGVVLQAALDDMPQHAQRTAQFASWEEEINAYHAVWREPKEMCGCGKQTRGSLSLLLVGLYC